jgi:hypothetical protein
MVHRKTPDTLVFVLVALASLVLCSCANPEQPHVEEQPKAQEPPPVASTASHPETREAVKLPPPQPDEVQEKVRTVFGEAAIADINRRPYFLVGDFNGDASQDLAVVLKPAPGKLDQLNDDYPKWMTRDPLSSVLPKPVVATNQPPLPNNPASARGIPVLPGDTLLAVIHGHGPKGWRDPEATQTYLLKNVAGEAIRTQERKEVARSKGKPMPQIDGDVIDQRLLGQLGFLYFSYPQASYEWYDPVHYKPGTLPGSVHGMKAPKNTAVSSGVRQGPRMASQGN